MKAIHYPIVLVCLLFLVIAGCNTSDENKSIDLGEVTRSVFYAPQYVALEKGVF